MVFKHKIVYEYIQTTVDQLIEYIDKTETVTPVKIEAWIARRLEMYNTICTNNNQNWLEVSRYMEEPKPPYRKSHVFKLRSGRLKFFIILYEPVSWI